MSSTLVTFLLSSSIIISTVLASDVWTVNCAPLTQQRSDPIFSPGNVSSHVHAVVGSTAFSRNMSGIDGAEQGNATTCDKYTDHSSYWSPALYQILANGTFELLPFTGMVAYYTNYTCSYNASAPGYCQGVRDSQAPPAGLRMVAGSSIRRTFNASNPWDQAILMETGDNGEVYGLPTILEGTRLSGHARFPSCWDGQNLDSPNHQSHVAYPDASLDGTTQGGMCPSSHPVAMLNIGAEFGFALDGITDPTDVVFSNGDTTGYGFHADFYMGWEDREALTGSFADCFDNDDCPWRSFGSPDDLAPNPTLQLLEVPAPVEDIGLLSPIALLPGDNPVYVPVAIKGRRPA